MRRTLPLHLTWLLGAIVAWFSLQVALDLRLGVDSHAYWSAWQGDWRSEMYDVAPGRIDAFNYSPAFALAIWPLAHLPWPVFGVLWSVAAAITLIYLLRPLGWRWVAPLLLCASPEILSGNIFWLLALAAAWGLGVRPRAGGWWAIAALTKVTPALGPVWFAVRRDWRPLAVSVLATTVIFGVSWMITPGLWGEWFDFLGVHEASTTQVGSGILPPLVWRLPLAVLLTAWGGLSDRPWLVPVAMVLATPVAGPAAFVMLAAIPRLVDSNPGEAPSVSQPAS